MWSFSHTPLVPGPCAAWKPQALSSRGWAWAARSGHLGRGRDSCREKPGGRGSGAQSRAAQSPAQSWRTDRGHSALCWQRYVLAPAVGRLPAGERVHVPGPDRSSLLLQSALRNPLPSIRNPIPSQALQTHPRLQIPGTALHPPAPVFQSSPSVCRASSPHFSSPLWRNGGLCGPASEASLDSLAGVQSRRDCPGSHSQAAQRPGLQAEGRAGGPLGCHGSSDLGRTESWHVTPCPCRRHSPHHQGLHQEGQGRCSELPAAAEVRVWTQAAGCSLWSGSGAAQATNLGSRLLVLPAHCALIPPPTPTLDQPIGPVPCPLSRLPGSSFPQLSRRRPGSFAHALRRPRSLSSTIVAPAPPASPDENVAD